MLKLNNLSFKYNKENILENLSLDIQNDNQIIALFGPNGAGKTTLLNVLAGFYQKYDGELLGDYTSFLLPDSNFIPGDMTIKSCLKDFQTLYRNFDVERASAMLDHLSLDINKKISYYSKGMKEQLHLIFTLAQDVDIYLLDEPLAAVDPLTRDVLIELILNYKKEGSIVLLSTHLIQDMDKLFEEVIFLNQGNVISYKTIKELRKEYPGMTMDDIYKEVNRHVNAY